MNPEQNEEHDWWQRLKKGDQEAFSCLFQAYHKNLYNYGIKLTPGQIELVEDAIQDVFIDLWRLRGGITDKVGSIRFYLYRVLRRKIHLSLQKKVDLRFLEDTDLDRLLQKPYETEWVDDEIQGNLVSQLSSAIKRLPRRQKEALTLRYFEGFSNPEIASVMEVNEKTVRNLLHKALAHLRLNQKDLYRTLEQD
ncbi:MAG: RNA polymerase sigma factor [Spirosomataceae bacterium]